ncbi:MAG TPA: pyruvate dehydrogenase (acetyl-transferring) E1 component subunit alpha [Enteractinococcus helveticum]|uniref:2-oxoisovalerate dehydrogenase subunit alpha n=1 Tax=Enteractinococcus helveticum TaxID=1837282 RepID=A0A921FQP9_9MICC|nr:thiamine pyrophosphate-dependent enzyme [Enteractinococcus helveticum]HJF15961.1 pyruvate dehydrogenase (acetyl-transferring) E1 component subunit alpha [Enteractinococcus helveticum]
MSTISSPTGQQLPEEAIGILSADGFFDPTEAAQAFVEEASAIGHERVAEMYRLMAHTRRLDQEGVNLQRQGQLVLWTPSIGQEAAQAGVVTALEDRDWIFPTYREHVMARGRGIPDEHVFDFFRGAVHGGWDPNAYNMQPYTVVLAAQVLHATGYAWGMAQKQRGWTDVRRKEEGRVSIACFGDGASTEGDVHEAMVFAASFDAPVVFFIQNNYWAISTPFEVQSKVPLFKRAQGYGFDGFAVDGNDPIATAAVMDRAVDHARRGKGPVLVEAHTYRMGAHTTADDPTKYRTKEEEQAHAQADPMVRTEAYLRRRFDYSDAFFTEVEAEGEELAGNLRDKVVDAPDTVSLREKFDLVYAEGHSLVEAQAAAFDRWMEGEDA